jgi:hypothetical protein
VFLPLALSAWLTEAHISWTLARRGWLARTCTLSTTDARNQLRSPSLTGAHCRVDCGQVRALATDRSAQNQVGPREIQLTSSANSAVRAPNACFELSPPVSRLACTLFQRTGRIFQCRCRLVTVKRQEFGPEIVERAKNSA